MRLLILSIRFSPEITSNAYVITGLARALAANGHQVTVLAGTPHYRLPRVPRPYLLWPFRREDEAGVRIVRCWAFPKSEGKTWKFLNYLTFTLTAFLASPFVGRPDAVLVVSPPFWLALIALGLRFFRRCPVIYNAQDLFPEAYLASGEIQPGWFTKAMEKLMLLVYRRTDRITVVTESFAKTISAKGIDASKIVSIPNFVDTSAVAPLPRRNSFSRKWKLDDKFVVMYAGNIGYTHEAELLVEAAEKLAALKNVKFLVVGGGSKRADLVRLARERRTTNLQFLPTQPSQLLPEMLASADVFVLASKRGVGEASFPSRIYNYLLAGRPVVASVDGEFDLARLLRESGAGLVAEPGDAEALSHAIETLYHDAAACERLARNGSEFMGRNYSPRDVVDRYDALLKQLVVGC